MNNQKVKGWYKPKPLGQNDNKFCQIVCTQLAQGLIKDSFLQFVSISTICRYEVIHFSPGEWQLVSQVQALFKKNAAFISKPEQMHEIALSKFLLSEEQCEAYNTWFEKGEFSHSERRFFGDVRHYVRTIIGDKPTIGDLNFGPGSSYSLKGFDANIVKKLTTIPDCTALAHDLVLYHILDKLPMYAISSGIVTRSKAEVSLACRQLPVVKGSRFSSVRKDARGNRPICIEPLGNMLIQKSLGDCIRSRLDFFTGRELSFTPLLHHSLVLESSISGINATIDLSSASDSIAKSFVKYILPPQWFDMLNACRSHFVEIDGSFRRLEKFSSMGNGFTFELETVIFLAVCLASNVKKSDVSVFGDDIVVPARQAASVIRSLELCGFTVNTEKTFTEGYFRESCGKDFYYGLNTRPIYIRFLSDDIVRGLLELSNRIEEIRHHIYGDYYPDFIAKIQGRIRRRFPNALFCGSMSDARGFTAFPHLTKSFTKDGVRHQRVIDQKAVVKVKPPTNPDELLSALLAGVGSNGITPRNSPYLYRARFLPVQ